MALFFERLRYWRRPTDSNVPHNHVLLRSLTPKKENKADDPQMSIEEDVEQFFQLSCKEADQWRTLVLSNGNTLDLFVSSQGETKVWFENKWARWCMVCDEVSPSFLQFCVHHAHRLTLDLRPLPPQLVLKPMVR